MKSPGHRLLFQGGGLRGGRLWSVLGGVGSFGLRRDLLIDGGARLRWGLVRTITGFDVGRRCYPDFNITLTCNVPLEDFDFDLKVGVRLRASNNEVVRRNILAAAQTVQALCDW